MDLVYMNEKREDIGVLFDYAFDLAYGKDENSFECTVNADNHCCNKGYYLYIEGSEYGGVIDKIASSGEKGTLTYKGRTWHGILEKSIIEPDAGEDYQFFSGEANQVLSEIIERIGLTDLFTVESVDSQIEIVQYPIRYENAYSAIKRMLGAFNGKLKMSFTDGKVMLRAVWQIDYSQDEEWDNSQIDFSVEKDYRPVNHLICLGKGDLQNCNVIHLFTDENGGILPYATTDEPISNEDYILDTSKQMLYGADEVTEVFEYGSAADTENYLLLKSKPADFAKNFGAYYQQTDERKFVELESRDEDIYILQIKQPYDWEVKYQEYYEASNDTYTSVAKPTNFVYSVQTKQPSDWKQDYSNYFTKSGNSYTSVALTEIVSYKKQTEKPSKWEKNYKDYYTYFSDGTAVNYPGVSGTQKYKYEMQTQKPSDWSTNFKNYFVRNPKKSGFLPVEEIDSNKKKVPTWQVGRYYTKKSYTVALVWSKNTYYTQKKESKVPTWVTGTYYTKVIVNVPAWKAATYYEKKTKTILPEWMTNTYYEKKIDSYAELVQAGIEKLQQSYHCDSISITLDLQGNYDIGDIVGATDAVTGIAVWQPIVKKIVTIKENIENIQYEVGE